jgi:rare lipoprotein A
MPLRRTIGISLACLVISAGAIAKTPDKSTSHQPAHPHNVKPAGGEARVVKTRHFSCSGRRYAAHHAVRWRHRHTESASADQTSGGPPDAYLGPVHPIAGMEIGKAAWYNRVGAHTSSGEVLDTVSATAAHRSLPLASYAKVTNLDSGQSVVVKINDRGPWTRGVVIDLSPRAADAIDVRRAGVAPVIVEPVAIGPAVANEAASTAAPQTIATPAAQ